MGLTAVLFVVLALAIAIVALAVAAWAAGYSRGVEDTARPMAEWYRHHMGDSKAICGNESRTTDKYSRCTETRR